MISVALIGADGAGKTTIAERLVEEFPRPVKYLYMGVNTESSNVALPTSRLADLLKRRKRKGASAGGDQGGGDASTTLVKPRRSRSKVRAVLRLVNRVAEEWYRQFLSWRYRRAGKIVIYDRHFRFDCERKDDPKQRVTDRLHSWLLQKFYPSPNLVIYLDAPAEVLYARKPEATLEYLRQRREAFLKTGASTPNFTIVDATQPLETVYAQVHARILEFVEARK